MNQHREEIRSGIAEIGWDELLPFFAKGYIIQIHSEMDMEEVGYQLCMDNASIVNEWIQQGKVCKVMDDTAKRWIETKAKVRSVVIQPWILVQEL